MSLIPKWNKVHKAEPVKTTEINQEVKQEEKPKKGKKK
jgi:hypothetical protein